MAALDEAHVEKKLLNLNNSQDAIQSVSLWAIHHKVHHEKLVDIWLRVLKKCALNQKLNLFYLCNDIVQTCKRKHAVMYKDAFREILKDAILVIRDSTIRPNVERILNIWEEREVYDAEFVGELITILNNTKTKSVGNVRTVAEFQPQTLVDKIQQCRKQQESTELKRQQLQHLKVDVTSVESVKQIKDRVHIKDFMKQFEDSCSKLEDVLSLLGVTMKERQSLIELLEQSELYYDTQYGEAKVVTNAYKIFGTRVSNLQKKLQDYRKTLPGDSNSPIPSPPHDAPSPYGSPGPGEGTDGNTQAVDMEMSDDEKDTPGHGKNSSDSGSHSTASRLKGDDPAKIEKPTGSIRPELDPRRSNKGASTWDSKLSALRPKEKSAEESKPSTLSTMGSSTGGSTPVKDEREGSGTPVMDEMEAGGGGGNGRNGSSRGGGSGGSGGSGSVLSNPIEFLSQLISQAPKPSTSIVPPSSAPAPASNSSGGGLLETLFSIVKAVPSSFPMQPGGEPGVMYPPQQALPQFASQALPMPPMPPITSFAPSGTPNIPPLPLPGQPFDQGLQFPPAAPSAPAYAPFYQTPAPPPQPPQFAVDDGHSSNMPAYVATYQQRDMGGYGSGNAYGQQQQQPEDFGSESAYDDGSEDQYDEYQTGSSAHPRRRTSFNSANLRTLAGGDSDGGRDDDSGADYAGDYDQQGGYGGQNINIRMQGSRPPFFGGRGRPPRFDGPRPARFRQPIGGFHERFGPPSAKRPYAPRAFDNADNFW